MVLRTRIRDGKKEVLDTFRRRYVALTPEEWVRQQFAHYLVDVCGYPAGRIGIEVSLKVNRMPLRTDMVIFGPRREPWMIIECKAPEVKLTHKVFDQASRYNYHFRAQYLTLTNGHSHICLKPDYTTGEIIFLDELPPYTLSGNPGPITSADTPSH